MTLSAQYNLLALTNNRAADVIKITFLEDKFGFQVLTSLHIMLLAEIMRS